MWEGWRGRLHIAPLGAYWLCGVRLPSTDAVSRLCIIATLAFFCIPVHSFVSSLSPYSYYCFSFGASVSSFLLPLYFNALFFLHSIGCDIVTFPAMFSCFSAFLLVLCGMVACFYTWMAPLQYRCAPPPTHTHAHPHADTLHMLSSGEI